jgi:hypothetical protein
MNQSALTNTIFKKAGAQLLQIRTEQDYVKILQQFFQKRKKTH